MFLQQDMQSQSQASIPIAGMFTNTGCFRRAAQLAGLVTEEDLTLLEKDT